MEKIYEIGPYVAKTSKMVLGKLNLHNGNFISNLTKKGFKNYHKWYTLNVRDMWKNWKCKFNVVNWHFIEFAKCDRKWNCTCFHIFTCSTDFESRMLFNAFGTLK